MTLETLYKRTKTGAIQYWHIKTVSCVDYTLIHKEAGQLGTKNPIVHTETIKEGKNLGKANATNHEQQAEAQALSDWTRKHDEGYKSLADLGISIINE